MDSLQAGDRIELVKMEQDPQPIAVGTRGTVEWVHDLFIQGMLMTTLSVAWDDGRRLGLIVPPDEYHKLPKEDL